MSDATDAWADPWVTTGSYDQNGCWHPHYFDDDGVRHDGWGWFDDDGTWQVAHGWFQPDGNWVDAPTTALPDEEPPPHRSEPDELPRWVGTSAASHAVMLLIAFTMPDPASALDLDGYHAHDRFVEASLAPDQQLPDESTGTGAAEEPETSARHAGDEGAAGDDAAPDVAKRMAVRGVNDEEDLELQKRRNMEIATNAGIASQVSSFWAVSDRSIGSEAEDAVGRLHGEEIGAAKGGFGFGIVGEHPGGGGKLPDSIGMGRVETKGFKAGGGKGLGATCGVPPDSRCEANLGGKGSSVPGIVKIGKEVQLSGGLDREIVRRIVRQHRRELKACYESELQKNRNLSGSLTVKFTIAPSGQVIAAVADGGSLQSPPVASCVTRRIRRWVFPAQNGMGVVVVRYPFNFHGG